MIVKQLLTGALIDVQALAIALGTVAGAHGATLAWSHWTERAPLAGNRVFYP